MNNQLTMFPETITTTSDIEVFKQCNYKWLMQQAYGWRKESITREDGEKGQVNLDAGKAFARATELMRKAFYHDHNSFENSVTIGLNYIKEEYTPLYIAKGYEHNTKNPDTLCRAFQYANNIFPLGSNSNEVIPNGIEDTMIFDTGIPHPDAPHRNIKLSITMDMWGYWSNYGRKQLCILDDKTCQKPSQRILTNQFILYTAALNRTLSLTTKEVCTTFLVREYVLKTSYPTQESAVNQCQLNVPTALQSTYLQGLYKQLIEMKGKYLRLTTTSDNMFHRNYGMACTAMFSECHLSNHCRSPLLLDLSKQGYEQVRFNKLSDTRTSLQDTLYNFKHSTDSTSYTKLFI